MAGLERAKIAGSSRAMYGGRSSAYHQRLARGRESECEAIAHIVAQQGSFTRDAHNLAARECNLPCNMPVFAAVDIGSNSCRLKIARVQQHTLKTLHEDREVTRLGESVFDTGVISPEAMANTIKALKRFHKAVQQHSVDRLRVVATSATRDARNAAAFLQWVKSATGWKVEVISGLEEGRLIHSGVVSNEKLPRGNSILIDLGGGSCEVTLTENGRIREMVSLPLGAVRLTQDFLRSDPPDAEDVARMRQFIQRELRKAHRRVEGTDVRAVLATSGTAAALAEASSFADKQHKLAKDEATARSVRKLADKLTRLDNAKRAQVPGIGPKRSEIVVAGAHVYADLLSMLGLKGYRYSPMGLRDGILAQMLAQEDTRTSAHARFEAERREAVLQLCRLYKLEPNTYEPIREHAAQLFRDLKPLHDLPPIFASWLDFAAMMEEAGKFINYQGWHRHTQYIVANSELFGFTPEERATVSAIARYLGKSRPSEGDRVMRMVPPSDHANVERAVVLLRLARALNQDRASDVLRVRVKIYPKRVVLNIVPGRTGAELELWALRKEAAYFRDVFGRQLVAEIA